MLRRAQSAKLAQALSCTEGKNRMIRRICDHLRLRVSRLKRVGFGPFSLKQLPDPWTVVERPVPPSLRRFLDEDALEDAAATLGPARRTRPDRAEGRRARSLDVRRDPESGPANHSQSLDVRRDPESGPGTRRARLAVGGRSGGATRPAGGATRPAGATKSAGAKRREAARRTRWKSLQKKKPSGRRG